MGQRMTGVAPARRPDPGGMRPRRRWLWRLVQAVTLLGVVTLYLLVVTRGRPMDWVSW